jgi:hypothetical protein
MASRISVMTLFFTCSSCSCCDRIKISVLISQFFCDDLYECSFVPKSHFYAGGTATGDSYSYGPSLLLIYGFLQLQLLESFIKN